MPLSAQQLAAQKNLSYVLAEAGATDLKGEYEPGTILPGEIELGEQFGVSRTAVREAVKTLTAKGWFYRDRELVPGSCHNRTGIFLIRNCLPGG